MPTGTITAQALIIDQLPLPERPGILGLTSCPGRWGRNLSADIEAIVIWGARSVISLIDDHEFAMLGLADFGRVLAATDLFWFRMPIPDVEPPGRPFQAAWAAHGPEIHRRLLDGEKILIHCNAGLGRTGTLAGLILVESGVPAGEAIRLVRAARPGSIESAVQEKYVRQAEQFVRPF